MKARDIMTPNVVTIEATASVADAVGLMRERGLHALIVERSGPNDAYGIVTDSDIVYKVVAYGKNPAAVLVQEVMTKPCVVVNPDLDIEYVARLLANLRIHRAPVIRDELMGIVSLSDILHRALDITPTDSEQSQLHPSPATLPR